VAVPVASVRPRPGRSVSIVCAGQLPRRSCSLRAEAPRLWIVAYALAASFAPWRARRPAGPGWSGRRGAAPAPSAGPAGQQAPLVLEPAVLPLDRHAGGRASSSGRSHAGSGCAAGWPQPAGWQAGTHPKGSATSPPAAWHRPRRTSRCRVRRRAVLAGLDSGGLAQRDDRVAAALLTTGVDRLVVVAHVRDGDPGPEPRARAR
jgi:hypothetical protein